MCLIAYVKAGVKIPDDYIEAAHMRNPDGIGIMSGQGVEKFLGHKMLKRARKHIHKLQDDGVQFAVHFRYATHGDITLKNVHPFELPDGNGYLMHNGVLSDYTKASEATNGEDSDTALFAREHTGATPTENWQDYWTEVSGKISGGRLCLMLPKPELFFILVNEQSGTWRNDVWYSQTYSLPWPKTVYNDNWRGTSRAYDGSGPYSRYREGGDGEATWWRRAIDRTRAKEETPKDAYYRNLEAAIERHYGEDSGVPTDHWIGWTRDKNGHFIQDATPVATEDKALDAVVTEHLNGEDCKLPGWSEPVEAAEPVSLAGCIDCGAPRYQGSAWCGAEYCEGEGYKEEEKQCRINSD